MGEPAPKKRCKVQHSFATNILFEHSLNFWKSEASKSGHQSQYTYSKALRSLKSYPLQLKSGQEAKILDGLGDGICKRLDEVLIRYREIHGDPNVQTVKNHVKNSTDELFLGKQWKRSNSASVSSGKTLSSDLPKRVLPLPRSSSYSAQSLTSDVPCSSAVHSSTKVSVSSSSCERTVLKTRVVGKGDCSGSIWKPGSFRVLLLVDWGEAAGAGRRDALTEALSKRDVPFERRRLAAGDFAWVARDPTAPEADLMLDWIVERKRIDDLASSICSKDNRYKDQKARLRQCGIKHKIYLIEDKKTRLALPIETLKQAINNTQVHEDFSIVKTKDQKETAAYLISLTKALQRKYEKKHLLPIDADDHHAEPNDVVRLVRLSVFAEASVRTGALRAAEVLARQLMVCRGMSADKSNAIVRLHPSFDRLRAAYADCSSQQQAESLLAQLSFGLDDNKKIGPALSKAVAQVFYDTY